MDSKDPRVILCHSLTLLCEAERLDRVATSATGPNVKNYQDSLHEAASRARVNAMVTLRKDADGIALLCQRITRVLKGENGQMESLEEHPNPASG